MDVQFSLTELLCCISGILVTVLAGLENVAVRHTLMMSLKNGRTGLNREDKNMLRT